jgi:dimethylhistidine N-methyltransferase
MPNDAFSARMALDPAVTRLALEGLRATPKTLPPQLFYDEEGCRLFYRITELPEYYLTRTEWSLLDTVASAVARSVPAGSVLVEYGASSEAKASRLLAAGSRPFSDYVAIDVAEGALQAMQVRLRAAFPDVTMHPIAADFEQPFALPPGLEGRKRFGFFPGSTIGNLDPAGARRFLRLARDELGAGSLFLIGADLRKPASILLPAYDDAAGVTAAFNRNLLVRLNREAGADFDPLAFDHRSIWNDIDGRIEMHLVSRRRQVVRVAGHTIRFEEGESIHTENSYKFTLEGMRGMAEAAGWALRKSWFDDDRRFGMFLLGAS